MSSNDGPANRTPIDAPKRQPLEMTAMKTVLTSFALLAILAGPAFAEGGDNYVRDSMLALTQASSAGSLAAPTSRGTALLNPEQIVMQDNRRAQFVGQRAPIDRGAPVVAPANDR
jgi:hypothetical protein